MRGLSIISLSIILTVSQADPSCKVEPGCTLYPDGCDNSDKICCTVGWDTTCSCCPVKTTPIPITTPVTTDTTTLPPTVQPTTTSYPTGTTVSLITSDVTATVSGASESTMTVVTTQFITTVPTSIVKHALTVFGIVTSVIVFVILALIVSLRSSRALRDFALTLVNSFRPRGRTPHPTNLIDLGPDVPSIPLSNLAAPDSYRTFPTYQQHTDRMLDVAFGRACAPGTELASLNITDLMSDSVL